jgi:hypothetical protein
VGRCQVMVDGRACGTPCGIGSTRCAFHKSAGKELSK